MGKNTNNELDLLKIFFSKQMFQIGSLISKEDSILFHQLRLRLSNIDLNRLKQKVNLLRKMGLVEFQHIPNVLGILVQSTEALKQLFNQLEECYSYCERICETNQIKVKKYEYIS